MKYSLIAVFGGIFFYAYYTEIITITYKSKDHTPRAIESVTPQPLTIFYPFGTTIKSETKQFLTHITPQKIILEWYNELHIQGLLESPIPPITIVHGENSYCTLIWKKHPLAQTRSLSEHAMMYKSLQQTLKNAGHTYKGIYWCDESGPLKDQCIAYEEGIRGEIDTEKISGSICGKAYENIIIYPYGASDDHLEIDGEYPRAIARQLSKEVSDILIRRGMHSIIIEDREVINTTNNSIVFAVSAIKKSPTPYTICWYESASDMVIYRLKKSCLWIPLSEAAALRHTESYNLGKMLCKSLAQNQRETFLAGGIPIAPLYGIIHPAVAVECCIPEKKSISLFSTEIADEIIRILQSDGDKN